MASTHLEGNKAKVFLVLAKYRAPLFRLLSLNVVREICVFLSHVPVLGIMQFNSSVVKILNVAQSRMLEMDIEEPVPAGSAICAVSEFKLVLVPAAASPTKVLDFKTQKVRSGSQARTSRLWPGIAAYGEFVYVFGGNPNSGMLKSCEKFRLNSLTWTNCPDMHTPKCCFTPCVYKQEIYLATSDHKKKQVEAFSPATEQYRFLPLFLSSPCFGSICCIAHSELVIISYERKAYSWRLDSQETTPTPLTCSIPDPIVALCTGTVVSYGPLLYWACFQGELLSFSRKDGVLTSVEAIR